MEPFSIRHGKSLLDQRIRVSMKERLRARLWTTVQKYNESWQYYPDPSSSWSSHTDLVEQTEIKLKHLLGQPELKVKILGVYETVGIEGFFMKGYPSCALEVIEQFVEELCKSEDSETGKATCFQKEVNEGMVAFECPWRLSDGRFFQIDATFFHEEIVQKGEDMLRERGFEGAHDEFREAREDLSDGKTKDVILKAFKSFESTLKTILGKHNGNATELLRQFQMLGYMDDIPAPQRKLMCNKVLDSIAVMRNELGGHGQGNTILEIPRPYALLALHLAGSLNQFVMEQYLSKRPPSVESAPGGNRE